MNVQMPSPLRSHNAKVNGAGYVWVAAMGPGVAPLGERSEHEPLLQGQVAATVAAGAVAGIIGKYLQLVVLYLGEQELLT